MYDQYRLLSTSKMFKMCNKYCENKRFKNDMFTELSSRSDFIGLGVYVSSEIRTIMFKDINIAILVSKNVYLRWIGLGINEILPRILRCLNNANEKGYLNIMNNLDESLYSLIYSEICDVLEITESER